MRLRKVDPRVIVISRIKAFKAGLSVSTRDLTALYLAGGHVPAVVDALIAADRADIELDWITAVAIDLAGKDILEAVQSDAIPKILPKSGSGED